MGSRSGGLSDDQGNVYITRWQGEMVRPSYTYEVYLFLEKYSILQQQILWSVQVNAEPIASDQAGKIKLSLTSSGIRTEFDRWVEVDPDGPDRETQRRVQASTFDSATGMLVGEELFEDPNRAIAQATEVVLAGRRYAISSRLGIRDNCVGLTALESP